jgi:hypothetical protein
MYLSHNDNNINQLVYKIDALAILTKAITAGIDFLIAFLCLIYWMIEFSCLMAYCYKFICRLDYSTFFSNSGNNKLKDLLCIHFCEHLKPWKLINSKYKPFSGLFTSFGGCIHFVFGSMRLNNRYHYLTKLKFVLHGPAWERMV